VEYPIKLISDIAVQLGADQTLFGGEHVMIVRVAGTGGIKKTDLTFSHIMSIHENTGE
jgi:hypothetical protein